jgi:hypothetical protein
MTRRASTFALIAALALFGPAPMSLCAAMASLPADCVPAPHCAEMASEQPAVRLSAGADNCCTVSSAPLPERQVQNPAPAVSLETVAAPEVFAAIASSEAPAAMPRARSAPSDLQSTLCVFLI